MPSTAVQFVNRQTRVTTAALLLLYLTTAYRDRCEIFLDIFYTPWPEALDCDRLVDSPDPRVCVGYREAHEPPDLGGGTLTLLAILSFCV